MGRTEIVNEIANQTGIASSTCDQVIEVLPDVIVDALKRDGKVMLRGFMIFEVSDRAEHNGRNPVTGKIELMPAVRTIKCRVGKAMKDAINDRDQSGD